MISLEDRVRSLEGLVAELQQRLPQAPASSRWVKTDKDAKLDGLFRRVSALEEESRVSRICKRHEKAE